MKKYKFTINGNNYAVEINSVEEQHVELAVNGTPYSVVVDREIKQAKTPKLMRSIAVPSTDQGANVKIGAKTGQIKAPLPGTVLDIFVKQGDRVSIGQKVLMLEAMKMENNIESDKAGIVTELKVSKGSSVMEGDVLIIIGE
ncbi:MAG: acetyl-CoA carboxylase biotin carboxyl carrier protein subunit [Odoribacteraceae bacterium]|jgi:biotin carboxyl carrier protein|nr:acetyl-CoA carboxylase biotin carboxyl carrier protein subunit [Odoribacteraceae bacterium]